MTTIVSAYVYLAKSRSLNDTIAAKTRFNFIPPIYKIGKCECTPPERMEEINGNISDRLKRLAAANPNKNYNPDGPYVCQKDWDIVGKPHEYKQIDRQRILEMEHYIHSRYQINHVDENMSVDYFNDKSRRKELFHIKNEPIDIDPHDTDHLMRHCLITADSFTVKPIRRASYSLENDKYFGDILNYFVSSANLADPFGHEAS